MIAPTRRKASPGGRRPSEFAPDEIEVSLTTSLFVAFLRLFCFFCLVVCRNISICGFLCVFLCQMSHVMSYVICHIHRSYVIFICHMSYVIFICHIHMSYVIFICHMSYSYVICHIHMSVISGAMTPIRISERDSNIVAEE